MTKRLKKLILIILAVIFGVLTLINSFYLTMILWEMEDMQVNFYAHFPFLTPSATYINIDDVSYIRFDGGVVPDPEKSANIEVRTKSRDEVWQEYRENYEKYENRNPDPDPAEE